MPEIDDFIMRIRRTWKYIGKTVRSNQETIPKKILGMQIYCPRKIGRLQTTFKNHFVQTLHKQSFLISTTQASSTNG